jgi:hypothetical protein
VTASVLDPFGNVLRITYSRRYLDILGNRAGTRQATFCEHRSHCVEETARQ